jgi:hypothetical protein
MKVPIGYLCTEEDINGPIDSIEPDWTIYADCLDCPAHWRGEYGNDTDAVRYRVDCHVQETGHRVKWVDAEQDFHGREPVVIGAQP